MIAMILWFLNIRHSGTLFGMRFLTLVEYVELIGKGEGYNSSHQHAKLKDGPKGVKKTFSMVLERFFLKCYDGGGENGITLKRIFEVEVSFSSQNINFPFI
jgi:hypothetical protein